MWTVSHIAGLTKCSLYCLDCLLDIRFLFDFTQTCFSCTRRGQKWNATQYCFLRLHSSACSLAWGGSYRDGKVWYLPFSSHTTNHLWTKATPRLICKPSDKWTRLPCTKCQYKQRDLHGVLNALLGFGHQNFHYYFSIFTLQPLLCLQPWDDLVSVSSGDEADDELSIIICLHQKAKKELKSFRTCWLLICAGKSSAVRAGFCYGSQCRIRATNGLDCKARAKSRKEDRVAA